MTLFYSIFYQINAALVSKTAFFRKHQKGIDFVCFFVHQKAYSAL